MGCTKIAMLPPPSRSAAGGAVSSSIARGEPFWYPGSPVVLITDGDNNAGKVTVSRRVNEFFAR